ncbi:MAG: pimeloyl-ACP methyl ester carboxylesterase [Candidatus Promineifilaceae bacterium]|jgi:pimeloyl-ACP methyl ester carboxylesterase
MLKTDGLFFKDEHGRTVMLRGVNLGGSSKLPVHPNGATHLKHGFYAHRAISFVGRPFQPAEADEHFARLRHWGFNCLRFLITWEAIEHAGPGLYDLIYLDYIKKMIEKAGEYGFYVFIDPHQDVWSRWTGGDGAPGWTLEKVGFKLENLHATGAAFVHQELDGEYPTMRWPTNYGKLACATMWTLFFGGNTFAPQLKIDDVPVQDYLQSHYINAVKQVAERVKDMPHVIGYDTLNEPSHGYIGETNLTDPKWGIVQSGASPSILDGMAAGAGQTCQVGDFEVGRFGIKQNGTIAINPNGLSAWQDGVEPLWQAHGVWGVNETTGSTGAELLKPGYFKADFGNDYFRPFVETFTHEIRSIHPDTLIFTEPVLGQQLPKIQLDGLVNAGHWYDAAVLFQREFNPNLGIDMAKKRPIFGRKNIARSFCEQLAHIKQEGAENVNGPTLVGEFGIAYDLNGKIGFTEANFGPHRQALDRSYQAIEANLLSSTQWNYTADNDNAHGDQWNGEDLSIFSQDQVHPLDDAHDLDAGGRAVGAFCRPYPRVTAGEPLELLFDINTREFKYSFRHTAALHQPTEIFVPDYHYGIGLGVEISDGKVEYDQENQLLRWFHTYKNDVHTIRLFREKGEPEIEAGLLLTNADGDQIVLEHHYRATNGIKLHTVEAGPKDGEMVILLHGFPEFWYGWKEQIPFLVRQGYRVVAPDQRGYNLSDKPPRVADYHLDKLADDIIGLMDGFKREKVFLVGHDWGAVVTWWLAARDPGRFYRAMVLNVPHIDVLRQDLWSNWEQMRKSWYVLAFQIPWLPEWLVPRMKILERSSHPDTFTAEDLQKYHHAWEQPNALRSMINWYRTLLRFSPKLRDPQVHIPMLIVWGTQDVALTRKTAVQSVEFCDDGQLYFLEQATHWVQHDEPEKVNQLIGRFLGLETSES